MSHLLIVDDNDMNRDLLSRQMQRQGHTFTLAEDGFDALEKMENEPFDLVLLDVNMPGMDGFGALERIKTDSRLKEIPVIMLTAVNELDMIQRAIELGAEDYLLKPFNSVLLRSVVDRALERKNLLEEHLSHPNDESAALDPVKVREPLEHSMRCIDQLLTRAAGTLNTEQAELLGIAQTRLTQIAKMLKNK